VLTLTFNSPHKTHNELLKFSKQLSHQVTPPDASSMTEAQGQLDNLFQSGNVNKAMQMAFAVLSANKGTEDARSVSSLDVTIRFAAA